MIKVIVTDDHPLFLDGIEKALSENENIDVVGRAADGEALLALLETDIQVDVIVLDISMPKLDGTETVKQLKKKYPNIKILIMTIHNEKEYIINLMNQGVSGYLLKDKGQSELINAIQQIQQGAAYYGLDVLNTIANTPNSPAKPEVAKLSDREIDVLTCIGKGLTSKQISEYLHISENTVHTHRRNLLKKLDLPNEKHLVRYAIKHKYVEL